MGRRFFIAVLALLLAVAAGVFFFWPNSVAPLPTDPNPGWFVDVAGECGIHFQHDAGDLSRYNQPQIHGSGTALFDFDGDGRLDVFLLTHSDSGSSSTNRLYRNLGSGQFQDVTEGSGLGFAARCTGAIAGDVNNDGRTDLIIAEYGGLRLFLNAGGGHFTDGTKASGLKNPLWGTSLNLVDFDRDGWLDLVVANYLENDSSQVCPGINSRNDYCGPLAFPPTVCRLFRNLGGSSAGRFEDVSVKSNLASTVGSALGVYCADYSGDGWPDLLIANDARPNYLWINQRNGTFKEEALPRGIALDKYGEPLGNMGIAAGDCNGDGLLDIYITHLTHQRNSLWQQGPHRGQFRDRTGPSGLLNSAWRGTGFGTLFGDFDNDGWLDLALVNGRIARGTTTPNPDLGDHLKDYSERNQLFRNNGGGQFSDISEVNPGFCGTPNVARGLASGDFDDDGRLDLIATTVAGPAQVYRNLASHCGHWLRVRAFDPRLKRDALGAELRLAAGGRVLLRIVNPGDSYQSSSDPRPHFGLGPSQKFDSLEVAWPDGFIETFPGGAVDRTIEVHRGQGKASRRNTP